MHDNDAHFMRLKSDAFHWLTSQVTNQWHAIKVVYTIMACVDKYHCTL